MVRNKGVDNLLHPDRGIADTKANTSSRNFIEICNSLILSRCPYGAKDTTS